MRRSFLALLMILPACHQPREMAPQVPLGGIDGKYTFTINNHEIKVEGTILVAYSQVHLLTPRYCHPIDGPKSSPEMKASWFECWATEKRREPYLRLRFSEIDPINHSRWYARMRVRDTVRRCTQYNTSGDCVELLVARGMKTVDRNGSITVLRGFPAAPDTGKPRPLNGTKHLRAKCDTTASSACLTSRREDP